jgi:hypothetical protein
MMTFFNKIGIVLAFLPLIGLTFFMTYMGKDDYTFKVKMATGLLNFFYEAYFQATGRYTMLAFACILNPSHAGMEQGRWALQLYTCGLVGAFVGLTYYGLRCFLINVEVASKYSWTVAFLLVIFILNSISLAQFLYWWVGANAYFVPILVYLFFVAQLAKCLLREKVGKGDFTIFCIAHVLVIGCHELLIVFHFSVLAYLYIHLLWAKSPKTSYFKFLFWIGLVAAIFAIAAPGNLSRLSGMDSTFNASQEARFYAYKPFWKLLILSGYFTLSNIGNWLSQASFWLCMWLLLPFMLKLEQKYTWRKSYLLHPLGHILFVLGLFYVLNVFVIRTNHYYAGRVQAFLFILFVFSIIFNLQLWVSYYYDAIHTYIVPLESPFRQGMIGLFLVISALPTHHNINNAYYELFLVAPKLYEFNEKRFQLITEARRAGKKQVRVPLTPVHLRSSFLLPDDFGVENVYFNKHVALYFGLESIEGIPTSD